MVEPVLWFLRRWRGVGEFNDTVAARRSGEVEIHPDRRSRRGAVLGSVTCGRFAIFVARRGKQLDSAAPPCRSSSG